MELWPNPSESRNWSNEEQQVREVHAKDSHKDNSLSEKAAKKIHEAGNCELHKTKFRQLIADAFIKFQRIGEVYTLMEYDGGCTNDPHNWK